MKLQANMPINDNGRGMMKSWIGILSCVAILGLGSRAAAQEAKKAPSPTATKVTAVTVYEDRALVSRTAKVQLPAGPFVVQLTDFPANLREASLRASVVAGEAKVVSVATRTEKKPQAVQGKVREAEDAVTSLERERARLAGRKQALNLSEKKLDQFAVLAQQAISERATMANVNVEHFTAASTLLRQRRKTLDAEVLEIVFFIEALDEKLKDARAHLQKVTSRGAKTLRTVSVSLESAQAVETDLTVSYIVRDCGWAPRYDVRLIEGRLRVAYQGDVRQKTGEDWADCQMALSTARPALGAKRPDLPRLRMMTKKVAVKPKGRGLRVQHDLRRDSEDSPIVPAAVAAPVADSSGRTTEARSSDTGVSVLFEVPQPATIPGDGRSHRVPITSFTDPKPTLSFETVPKLVRAVYLRCDTVNATTFPMLAGPVDIWRASGFIGASHIQFSAPGSKIALSLGVDETLKVRRTLQKHHVEDEGLLKGKKAHHVVYDIEVANYRNVPQTVRIRENYPVSDVEEAEVHLLSATTTPQKHDKKDGLLTWEPMIASGEKATIRLEYKVIVPKDFRWNP